MNLRDNKTYIDELLERVQDGQLNPDEASILLWAILDNFNRAYLAATDTYQNGPWSTHLRKRSTTPVASYSDFKAETDGTRTPLAGSPLNPKCPACGEAVKWVSAHKQWEHADSTAVPHAAQSPVSPDNTLYCYKCKGAVTFQNARPGVGRWMHLNPVQQEDHKPDLTGISTNEGEIPEDWDTEEQIVGDFMAAVKDQMDGPWNDVEMDESVDVLAGEDPEEDDTHELRKLDAKPEITLSELGRSGGAYSLDIQAGSVSPGAYSLWNQNNPETAAEIHRAHKDGGLPERA